MNKSTERFLTTHCGSMPRPSDLLDIMKLKFDGEPYDHGAYIGRLRSAVAETVSRQVECGIDIPSDGEQGKAAFHTYMSERLVGFEGRPGANMTEFADEQAAFPEYYEEYFARAMAGGAVAPVVPMACTGPITYIGQEALQRDIDNLKSAVRGLKHEDVFMPAVAPSGVGTNEYYPSEEEYMFAVAEALSNEYQGIVDAGFILQIDDPFLSKIYSDSSLGASEKRKRGEIHVESVNHGLRGIPPEKVRYHTCYGINEGPRVHDAALKDVFEVMINVKAGAFSFEAANGRHEHEYKIFKDLKLAEGTVLVPGVITHSSNIVEHPELIAERILRYANLVGREQVIAGADCGFSTMATYSTEVHPTVVWAKFQAMAQGARLATQQLWGN